MGENSESIHGMTALPVLGESKGFGVPLYVQ